LPRRAGVSSFGFGGVNAHVVLEEYIGTQPPPAQHAVRASSPHVIVLSAKNDERLQQQLEQLLEALSGDSFCDDRLLPSVAYTLQVGRDSMDARWAVIAATIGELRDSLRKALQANGNKHAAGRRAQKVRPGIIAALAVDEEIQEAIEKWARRGKLSKIVDFWMSGGHVDWQRLWSGEKPQRLSLPTYPFAQERYWATAANAHETRQADQSLGRAGGSVMEHLLDELAHGRLTVESALELANSGN
jgi:polyketide synthase PksN